MGAGFVPRRLVTGSLGLDGSRHLHTSSLAVHQQVASLLRNNLLFYSEGKYLSEQMMFLSG